MAVGLVLGLGSCVTRPAPPLSTVYERETAAEVFSVGFEGIADFYIEAIPMEALSAAALDGVSTLDPELNYVRRGDRLIVTVGGTPFADFRTPEPNDVARWAMLTSAAIDAGRYRSQILRDTSPEHIYQAAFDSTVRKLDRFSRYSGRDKAQSERASRNGYSGIGVTIGIENERVWVTSVFPNSPATDAGLETADRIVAVDGVSIAGLDLNGIANRLRGPTGSHVELTIERNEVLSNKAVERRRVIQETVELKLIGQVAYLHLSGFNRDTVASLRRAIDSAERTLGEKPAGLILDMRQNRGGILNQAAEVADVFIDQGTILETRGRHRKSAQLFEAEHLDALVDVPMVVVVDSGSASAAEVVAAALQDSGRALLIGARSYGKGTVQQIVSLPNNGELILTWARMHAPSGYALSTYGVFPSVCTANAAENPTAMLAALRAGTVRPGDAVHRRRVIDTLDPARREALGQWCRANHPPRSDDADTEIALRLLGDRALFQQAFNASRIALGQRPATIN